MKVKYQSKALRFIGVFYLIVSTVVLLSPGFPGRIMAAVISLTATALCLIGSRPIVIHLDEASDLVRVKRPSFFGSDDYRSELPLHEIVSVEIEKKWVEISRLRHFHGERLVWCLYSGERIPLTGYTWNPQNKVAQRVNSYLERIRTKH